VGACARNGVVPGDANQVGRERVACSARSGLELTQGLLRAWPRRELAAAHCKRAEHECALVIVGQGSHQLSQKVEGLGMRLNALGRRRRRDALSTEHSGVDEDIGEKRFADGDCHVLQASCLTKTSVLRRRSA
jgi:hypothetical protein